MTSQPDVKPVPDAKRVQQLMMNCQGLVRSLAWKIHCKLPRHVELDDLVGYGQVGLAEAASRFDPKHGVQFTTFAYYRIRGEILDGLSKMSWFEKSDYNRDLYERNANEILSVEEPESEDSGYMEDLRWFKRVTGALAIVYLFSHQGDGESAAGSDIEDPRSPAPDSRIMTRELVERVNELIDALPAAARSLIRAAYFEGVTLTEAAQRLGMSKSWASRLHSKTLDQLSRSLQYPVVSDRVSTS